MFRLKTVFVIGAGGSCAYDFPSGPALLADARKHNVKTMSELIRDYYTGARVDDFLSAVRGCLSDSLDTLLEHRDDCEHIGRLFIASKILRAEFASRKIVGGAYDWLSYLFQRMDDGCSSVADFATNPVTFVTYNYDRLLELRITDGLRARYLRKEQDPDASIKRFWLEHPVLHLHGSLGDTERVPYGAAGPGDKVLDDAIANLLERAAGGIKIVHQADGQDANFNAARAALANAERVVFLGFSFGRSNVDRLGFENISKSAAVFSSRYQMTDAEVALFIKEPFAKLGYHEPTVTPNDTDDCKRTLARYLNSLVSRY